MSSAIDGSAGLIKTGTGSLTLSGASTYTGPTQVNGGTLIINGSLAAGSAHGWADVHRYGIGSTSITGARTPVHGSTFTIKAEPYSLTTVNLP